MNCSKIKRLLKRFNLLPAKRKCRKKLRRESCVSYESHVDKEIQKLYESFSRRCISQDYISEMRMAFSLFDKDKSGYICSKEFGSLLRTLGYNPTEVELNNLMVRVDVDHNGKIDLMEFIWMMHDTLEKTDTMEDLKIAFRAFDTDGDGRISKDEFRICMLNLRFGEEEISDMVRQADSDMDGSINFIEFVQMLTQADAQCH